ncbi:RWA1 [Symbiodinium sp. KB8]|nr:RWA1 [Symbiodinium sp. KB8]
MKSRSEARQPLIPEPGKLQDALSESQIDRMSLVQVLPEEDGSAASRFSVAAVREGSWTEWFGSPGDLKSTNDPIWARYGSHSQLQIAAALFCSLVLATWAAAEASSYLRQHPTAEGYDVAAQNDPCEPPAERVGVADADQINAGDEKDVEQANLEEASMAKGLPDQDLLPVWLRSHQSVLRAGAEMSVILGLLYLCDRTEVLPEAGKVRDPRQFWAVWAAIVVAALFTVRKGKDSAPLSREQTDEWKGWMQIMFLMYHYFEEKEVYNAIRVYIAAYVWMTGYGNFFLYRKGKSYTIRRTLQMLFRLNFLGFAVCTVLGNEYMLYYICPMHTIFTVFVLLAMYIGHSLNTSGTVLWVKIVLTFALTLFLYDGPDIIFRLVFGTLPGVRPLFAFHDPLHPEFTDEMHEFHFRSGLDRFIWIVGMVFALHYEHAAAFLQKLEKDSWPKQAVVRSGMILVSACVGIAWWHFAFRLPKLEYNKIHPYTSFVPLTIYLMVRNLTPTLREYHLHLFAYMGRVTLETYIFQFHIWMRTTGLNGSPKKLLAVIPGYFWPNLVIVSGLYLFVSIRFSHLTGVLRDELIPESLQSLRKTWVGLLGVSLMCWQVMVVVAKLSARAVLAVSWRDLSHPTIWSGTRFAVSVVDTEGLVVAEDDVVDALQTGRGSVEAKMERMLTWMLAPAVHGIPKLGVLPAEERAAELLCQHDREVEAAVREVVAGSERSVSTVVLNFCLERIPVLGCPTVLLRTTWGNLRSILIVAAMYGHDLESARVQHEALLCLVPPGDDKDSCAAALKQQNASDLNPATLVSATAQQVARFMIRGALRRATGLQAAVDCFELASLLYSSCGNDALDEDGFVHVTATPASAARDFFRHELGLFSEWCEWCSLPFLVLGMAAPNLFMIARFVPTLISWLSAALGRLPRAYVRSAPAVVLFLTGPCVAIYLRPNVQWRKRARTSGILSLFGYSDVGRWERAREKFEEAWPQTVTALVFLLHALLPAISTMSSLSVVLSALSPAAELHGWQGWDLLNRVACASLGLYSLFSVVLHQLQREYPEDELSTASVTVRAIVRGVLVIRVASRAVCFLAAWLYVLLIIDFGADQLWFWREGLQQGTPLGILGPMAWLLDAERSHLFANEKSVIFCMNLISVISQQRLVEVLSRREVLLRLIGAERVMASTICLLLKGVAVACTPSKSANPIAEFLVRVAPPPACCVAIVALRDHALPLGIAVVVAPRVTAMLGSSSCMLVGLCCGAYAAHAVLSVWYSYRGDLDSAALRLAMLVPGGVSSQAKGLLRGVLAGAHRRAVQLMAMGILQRAFRWLTQR